MVEWIISNKEWIFSGLGIAIISAFFAILKTNLTKEKQQSNIKIVDISLNEDKETIFYKGIMPSETGFRFSSGL